MILALTTMKAPDVLSTLLAGLFGALIYVGYETAVNGSGSFTGGNLFTGFLVGAGVQVAVRVTGMNADLTLRCTTLNVGAASGPETGCFDPAETRV